MLLNIVANSPQDKYVVYKRNFFFFQAEDGIRDVAVTGVQTCALPIYVERRRGVRSADPGGDVGTARGTDEPHDRAPTLDGPARRPDPGSASRPDPRGGEPRGPVAARRPLRPTHGAPGGAAGAGTAREAVLPLVRRL